jgi:repressor LexA
MSKNLTQRQKEILEYIRKFRDEKGYPPTIREIATWFGFTSTFGVQRHLDALRKKGYLSKDSNTSRGFTLVGGASVEPLPFISVPVIGRVAAGVPITAIENFDGNLLVDKNFLRGRDTHFALKVKGDSMIDDGIFEGDYVIVSPETEAKNDEIIVARIGDEATVKRFQAKAGHIQLIPANTKYKPITVNDVDNFAVIGKVVGVMRWLNQ